MKNNRINVLIPDGEAGPCVQVVRCLGITSKYNVFVLSSNKYTGVRNSRYCNRFIISNNNLFAEEKLDHVIEIIKKYQIDIILPVFLPGFEFCLKYKETIKKYCILPLLTDHKNYSTAAYKDRLVKYCRYNGIKVPKTLSVKEKNFLEKLDSVNFPILLKPADKYSGSGIQVFYSKDDLIEFVTSINKKETNGLIVQEYLNLETVGVNVICQQGKIRTFTIQRGLIDPPTKFSFSEVIQFIDNQNIIEFVQQIMMKLNWQGVTNIDILYDFETNDIYLLEINPRFWGTTLIASAKAGVNFPDLLIQLSLNPDFNQFPNGYRKIKYAKLSPSLLKQFFNGNSPVKLSETGIKYLFIDPLPSLAGKFNIS